MKLDRKALRSRLVKRGVWMDKDEEDMLASLDLLAEQDALLQRCATQLEALEWGHPLLRRRCTECDGVEEHSQLCSLDSLLRDLRGEGA